MFDFLPGLDSHSLYKITSCHYFSFLAWTLLEHPYQLPLLLNLLVNCKTCLTLRHIAASFIAVLHLHLLFYDCQIEC